MPTELNLRFPDAQHVIVTFEGDESGLLAFTNPITEKNLRDIQWYVETYGAHSLGDPDDTEAARIKGQLAVWGTALFNAAFKEREAQGLLNRFQNAENDARLLTISTQHPAILILPWELLHDPASGGGFLFMENPRISIRRRVAGSAGPRGSFKTAAKDSLHLLFVVSRPDDSGFMDPRADSKPVLDAIDEHAPGRVICEFLRPPTLDALIERLEDKSKPDVDIVHFDGHGVFDREGGLPSRAAAARATRTARQEEILRDKKTDTPGDPECPPNTGYLLFETVDGQCDFVTAEKLGANLHRHKVGLVILSACQSAAVENDEAEADAAKKRAMGSVAARLTATGIPSVLAMTHSVLVATTRILFGEFYKELARHKSIGEALDNARRYLSNHPEKFDVQRGPQRVKLKLDDWFLPALYQPGADGPLLKKLEGGHPDGEAAPPRSNLPAEPEAGFFGRKRALWEIERWFAGSTRRITLTGFGGQGKTALAQEAGRWLLRTGLFRAVVFVDYTSIQTSNALGAAVANIGSVLGQSLIDADAATAALKKTPTLIILDNLEALAPESLQALLSAAVPWSTAGGSRLLCTTRQPEFGHADYRLQGTRLHRRIALDGLGSRQSPDDALEWCAALMKMPPAPLVPAPKREALIELFEQVKFHPLSIRVLAQQLKTRRPAELGERLEQLLAAGGKSHLSSSQSQIEDTPVGLLASLELSLDKLDATARQVLPRLGVFQGAAMENNLIAITGLGDNGQRESLAGALAAIESGKAEELFQSMGKPVPGAAELQERVTDLRQKLAALPPPVANLWPALRRQLEAAALIEAEDILGVGVPFLRFHPTLASMLWAQLDAAEQIQWSVAHRQRYYALSSYLYKEDDRNPHQTRAIAWRELPNLLHAAHAALDVGDPDAVDFADNVDKFLGNFGLKQEASRLAAKAQAAAGEKGSRGWFLVQSNRGEQLFKDGQIDEAAQVFQAILAQLGDAPSYGQANTLGHLGRCFREGGRPDLAAQTADEAIVVCDQLQPTDGVKRQRGMLLTEKADALAQQGKYVEARKAYQESLKVDEELNDIHGRGVTLGQLGTLAFREGNLNEAVERHRASLVLFQRLREPAGEAVARHQLGVVFEKARQWEEAELHYRESARIEEESGNLVGAAQTWNQLASVNQDAGKPDAAEMWYRKSIEGSRSSGNLLLASQVLNNFADLLRNQPNRLAEARQLAEEALAIDKTVDPSAAEIWKTYGLLALIADREAEASTEARRKAALQAEAREYLRLARESKRNFAGTRHELRQFAPIILATVVACDGDPEAREVVTQYQQKMSQAGPQWQAVSQVLDRILGGERDETTLCEGLNFQMAMIIEAILQGLADPSTLADLLPNETPGAT